MRRLLSAAVTASLLLAQAPVMAEGIADDIGVMSVSLKETIKPRFGVQGQTQGAGTPNQAGVGGFLPISVGDNSVFYADVEVNADFGDYSGYSSIINTTVAGTTVSTSSRLGYRWLNDNRSWMYGFNAGYDSRPLKAGKPDTGVKVTDSETVFFQQVAANFEAVSPTWNFGAYALVPIGDTEQRLNSYYQGGALDTYGLDVGYFITPKINTLVGYYYQDGDDGSADTSGVKARLAFAVADEVEFGGNYSYDNAFHSRVSADLTIRFGGGSHKEKSNKQAKAEKQPQIKQLSASPKSRDVRVHDANGCLYFKYWRWYLPYLINCEN